MDGHWDWAEGGDDADTADLGGDAGHDLHSEFSEDYGADFGDGGHDDLHGGFGVEDHDLGGHLDAQHGDDSLEEPMGTEHATAEYDQALHESTDGHDGGPYDEDAGHDPGHDGGGDPGHDDGHDGQQHEDVLHRDDEEQPGHEAAFGADPDVHAGADDPAWHEVQFPQELHLDDPPEPVDGFPWSDADVLGGGDHSLSAAYDPAVAEHGGAEPGGLADYAGVDVPSGADPWSLLLGSEDPATSSLATFWLPQ
ncbi:hypothetical protein [Dactylosporangium darangshiense]|uniref:Uncharacterized protein n=1 Tax=Dactylosporangium darangshiense TaxID=579108 RepID=A0ABP8DGT8_9ACTN